MQADSPKLVKDLGTRLYSGIKRRFGIYSCGFCGTEFEALTNSIKTGAKRTCGCLTKKMQSRLSHGDTVGKRSRLHMAWSNMKTRCLNKNNKAFKNYGGRGISICDEWVNDFSAFKEFALSSGYEDSLTIERINVNGNYEPSNCTWIPLSEQAKNRRKK